MNSRLHRTVLEDLEYLQDAWKFGRIDEGKLRRDSTTLRKLLLNERLLSVTWHDRMGDQAFMIYAPVMPDFEKEMPSLLEGMVFYSVGGAHFGCGSGGARRGPTQAEYDKMSPEEKARFDKEAGPVWWPMSLNRFVSNRCLYALGQPISRRNLITFVANKLGGAHFDVGRGKPYESALERLISSEGTQILYFELLSAVQHLMESPDTVRLMAALRAELPNAGGPKTH